MKNNYTLFLKFLLILFTILFAEAVQAQSGVYVGGHFRRERPSTVDILKKSGMTYVILFNVNVEPNGDLTTDGELICTNGTYVFGNTSPYYKQDVASLKQGVTSVNRVEFCIGGWGNNSYVNIKNLINSQGTGTGSILYRNFAAFKAALPSMDAVNNDDEHGYDANTAIRFHVMMKDLGMQTTVAPYTNWNYWNTLVTNVNSQRPGTVDRIDLQCYDGGAGNNPCDWRIGGVKLHAGMLNFDSQQTIKDKMTNWKNNCGVTGGFIWVYNDSGMRPGDYAKTINGVFGVPIKNMNAPVNVFKHCNYEGFANGLTTGEYNLSKLQSLGILDNDISGITIGAGLEAVLYDGDNFTGTSVTISGDNGCLVQTSGNWNDRVSSLKIRMAGVEGTGDGLTGNYFNGMNFETHIASRKDATINMDWGDGSPISGVNAEQFSVRWTGLIEAKYSGEYTFYVNSDNGRRLWVNGQLIIDKWIDDWNIDYTGKITLAAGQKYEIKLEYFENNGGAGCKMEWSSSAQSREVISSKQLYPNTLPAVSISSPVNNATYTAPASITINVNASDAGGSIAKVDFYNGNTLLGSDNSSPYSFSWNNVSAGTYNLMAVATDNRGGVTNSAIVKAIVNTGTNNNIAPSVNITSPANSSSYTAPASVTINANATDSDGSISSVEFFNGSTSLGSDNSSPYSIGWNNVSAGTYIITAKATDNAGAVSTSQAITIKVVAPNQAPAVSISTPANNASFNTPANISFTANAKDTDGSISKVEYFNGSALIGSSTTSPYNISWNNVGAGVYSITAKATDNQGAVTTSSAISVKVNTVVTNPCTGVAQYKENNGYVAGSIVQNAGNRYKCNPWPASGWCNGAAWAYGPGTGQYWTDAWTLIGSCTGRLAGNSMNDEIQISPNPTTDVITLELVSTSTVSVYNTMGMEVVASTVMTSGATLDLSMLPAGMYLVKIDVDNEIITKTILKK